MTRNRARDLGLPLAGATGPNNAITDVDGVLVGYETLDGTAANGRPIKTGVTAILPHGRSGTPMPVWAGFHALNGNGEVTGTHWIEHGGYFVGPVCLTNSHSVGIVHHAATRWMLDHYASHYEAHHLWAMPVVAETYDGVLNDVNGQHVDVHHARAALDAAAGGAIAEGNVGGGNGMICYGFKGGTGTASRRVRVGDEQYTVGVLVQANHGKRDWLQICGVPVGEALVDDNEPAELNRERGSIIAIVATDAPMLPHQLKRLAQRAGLGIGRAGSPGGNDSGDMFLAFSTANQGPLPQLAPAHQQLRCVNNEYFDPFYMAAVQATDEAVLNALFMAEGAAMHKPAGWCPALDVDRLAPLLRRAGIAMNVDGL
ncbi:P1 family peptidase [Salinisphaera hydrothermalis]|uniref:Aminopeptidase DmpA n=1 Tax=Salinisphaera hydrothermalis (strain C41B8) TaxID=1304275 RepID=A0A084IRM1_SALHC|nr:P1 family peptidase [Salinisphaera hydrothermalis]KEZ79355.1 aminopeptidase DmpA [Salinisphaera hydrothermalis C41B8]